MYFVYTNAAEFPLTKDNSLILYHTFSCEQLDFFIGTDPNPNLLITSENQGFISGNQTLNKRPPEPNYDR